MTIRIYNTLSRKKEAFDPITPGKVSMYVCGPTVYDSCHIGHARSVVVFDVIAKYFKASGFDVTYVRNFTDVDDKIIKRAAELGVDAKGVADKYIQEFYDDMGALNVDRADIEPLATTHIDHMIRFIETLMDKGLAYDIDGDVYYAVEAFKGYGKLSGRKLEDMEAGARVDVDARKRNPFDFALWKAAKPGEPSWDSPWGKGRPGWHIECSAMSGNYLGETFDIHGGGKDLIFPHHENEIAQSEGATGKPFAKYWVHNGFVNIDHEKMSKSLGNFLMIKDVIASRHPDAVRLFLLSNHYRSPIDFTEQAMTEAGSGLDKIYSVLERIEGRVGAAPETDPGEDWTLFCEAMDDDFNTAKAVGLMFEAVRRLNRTLDDAASPLPEDLRQAVETGYSDIRRMGKVLGILSQSPAEYFEDKKAQSLGKDALDPQEIEALIQARAEARKAKDWAKADDIRQRLSDMNVVIEDRPEGTVWKMKS